MALISKPDYTYIWSSGGSKTSPTNTKIQTGWTAEVPPFQYENWIQNRQDQAIAHIFQRGIAQWDGLTNYEANVCYVTGTDGLVYKSVAASGPATTSQDPVTDSTDTYWTIAFATPGSFLTPVAGDARYAQLTNNLSDLTNIGTARTNLSVYSKSESNDFFAQTGVVSHYSNLKITTTGTSALVTITADELVVKNYSNNRTRILRNISLNPSVASSGNGGIDTGSSTVNTWYAVWVIYNETTDTQGAILSLSATSPTMPAGYTFRARVGWIRTDSTGNKFPLSYRQVGEHAEYVKMSGTNVASMITAASGTTGNTMVSVSIANYVPSTARSIKVTGYSSGDATAFIGVAPSTQYTVYEYSGGSGAAGAGTYALAALTEILLQSTDIAWQSNSTNARLYVQGWRDSL